MGNLGEAKGKSKGRNWDWGNVFSSSDEGINNSIDHALRCVLRDEHGLYGA